MDRVSTNNSFSLIKRLQQEGIARLVSDLINPLILPPAVIGLTSWLMGLVTRSMSWIMGISIFFYTLLPLAATYYLLSRNHISSLDLPERTSRNRLYLISIGCAAIVFLSFSLFNTGAPWLIAAISLVYLINPLIGLLVNLVWKMSIHSAALSSAGAIFLFLAKFNLLPTFTDAYILSLSILLLLLPIMIWARYRLSIHTLAELVGGALAGFLLTILELSLLINIW